MADRVEIVEVGARDGLQNLAQVVPLAQKLALIQAAYVAGLRRIEVGAYVSPKWVPQMAESALVVAGLEGMEALEPSVLVPNMTGYEAFRAAAGRVREVAIFASASDGFSMANLNCSVAQSLDRLAPVAEAARRDGFRLRGYVSCVTDCPFDGPTPPEKVADVARVLDAMVDEISLGDTLGTATPDKVSHMLSAVLADVPAARLAGHFHDTGGRALDNIEAALALGLRVFDSAIGGLGGCPYAPGAPGNVATEGVVSRLHALGFETGVDAEKLITAVALAREIRDANT